MHFGLVGKSLSHSFSKAYFGKKFEALGLKDYSYKNYDLQDISEIADVLNDSTLRGLNVTAPYKESVMPYLDALSDEAKAIGAVNCIRIHKGIKTGFNTDVYGFKQSIKPFLEPIHNKALIFGTGGSSKAVSFALKQIGVDYYYVTSGSKKTANTFLYPELNEVILSQFLLLINCTPLGLYPKTDECVNIPYSLVTPQHLAYDLIYNPPETLFLQQCSAQGATVMNGLSMLQLQAEKSWEIWTEL
ncbi:MAG: shikimate dehydrogenase family protein [Bacteroidia bacterium]